MSNSNNSQTKPNRAPSRRDQDIFRRVVVHCELQCEVAKDLGLSPGRISQILSHVRRWLACGVPNPVCQSAIRTPQSTMDLDATFSALERQRLQRQLAHARHEYLYELSIREIHKMSANPKHTTIRVESKPSENEVTSESEIRNSQSAITKIVTTTRDQPLNVQLIKTAQRSAIELQMLAELDPLPAPEISATADRRAMAEDLVTELMDDAAASNKVRSVGWDTERDFVDDLFKFLLGEPHRGVATNIIAADAQHGRLRSNHKPYPGRDPMLVTSKSPLPGTKLGPSDSTHNVDSVKSAPTDETHDSPNLALKNPKPQNSTAIQNADLPLADPPAITGSAITPSDDPPAPVRSLKSEDSPLQNPKIFSSPPPSEKIVRLTCPIVVNPP